MYTKREDNLFAAHVKHSHIHLTVKFILEFHRN